MDRPHRLAAEPSALLLDLDGLLADSEPIWFLAECDFVAARTERPWTHEHAARCIGRGLPNTVAVMCEVAGTPIELEVALEELADRVLSHLSRVVRKSGCDELLELARAAGVPAAVASSSPRRVVRAVLDHLGISPRFGAIVTGSDVERLKPEPDIFLAAAHRLGADIERCIVLEDSLAGATAGHRAGMRVIAVPELPPEAHEPFRAVADVIVRDLHEAAKHIAWPGAGAARRTGAP